MCALQQKIKTERAQKLQEEQNNENSGYQRRQLFY